MSEREISIPLLEISIVNHCNLHCRACNHASPAISRKLEDPSAIVAWCEKLAFLGLRAKVARLLGGEPLLHPSLVEIVRSVKASGIATEVEVLTNGTRLVAQPREFWESCDTVRISVYPGIKIPRNENFVTFADKIRIKEFPQFSESYSSHRHATREEVRKVYDACRVRLATKGIVRGRFYRCMRAPYITQAIGLGDDGRDISTLTADSLRSYLDEDKPLHGCLHCTGSSGKWFHHEQLRGAAWLQAQDRPLSEMLEEGGIGK